MLQKDTFKAPCCCFEDVPNTALTVVWTINVSIDCNWFQVPNPNKRKIYLIENQDDKMLGLFMFFKIIVCKDDDFSAFRTTKFMNENFVKRTWMYTRSTQNGIDCCNNQPSSCFVTT